MKVKNMRDYTLMTKKEEKMYDKVVDEYAIATSDEVAMVRAMASGSWEDILNGIVEYQTGYSTLEDYEREEMGIEEEVEMPPCVLIFDLDEIDEVQDFLDELKDKYC